MKKHLLILTTFLILTVAHGQTSPKLERQDIDNCFITNIEKSDYATTIYFKYVSEGKFKDGGWACAGKDFFIEDVHSGKRFKMLKANNIPICPDKHQFTSANQELNFSIDFEPINGTDKINVIENELESAFNFFGVEVPQTKQSYFNVKSTTVYLIVALIMTFLVNLFFRKRLNWWTLLLLTAIPNFIIGVLVIYFIATLQYEKVFFNFNEQNLAGQFGESLGNTLIAFLFIAPFFKRKKQKTEKEISKKENKWNPLRHFKKLPQGAYRLVIAGWIVLPLLVASIGAIIVDRHPEEVFFPIIIFGIPIYYILARLGGWVYLGFQNDKPKTNDLQKSTEPINLTKESENAVVESEDNTKPKSFYLSIILTLFLFISITFIVVLFNQIINYRMAGDASDERIKSLIENIKSEQNQYKIHSLVGSKTQSEECPDIDLEFTVENKLDFPIRIYISRPIKNSSTTKWEQFTDSFWQLEPGYSGRLTLDNKPLTVSGYRYYVTDTDGNSIIGSPKRPVYTSILDNILQGLKIY